MPRYSINYHGKWACFTSISEGFITSFMEKSDYENWRMCEYGINGYRPAEQYNMMTMEKAVFLIRLNRSHEEALDCLFECGLSKGECDKLLYDMETEHYCPVLKDDEKYECPNCGSEVGKGQISCIEETCEIEFVWRL